MAHTAIDKEAGLAEHYSNTSPTNGHGDYATKPTFKQKLKRHYRRFWWLHVLIFIAITLIITLPL